MKITEYMETVRERVHEAKNEEKKVILIPTAGGLREEHQALIEKVRGEDRYHDDTFIVLSIFDNPRRPVSQEGKEPVPQDLKKDVDLAQNAEVDLLFVPDLEELFPGGFSLTMISVAGIPEELEKDCGLEYFQSAATAANKLLNIVQPSEVYYLPEDQREYIVIKQMANDLKMPLRILLAEGD